MPLPSMDIQRYFLSKKIFYQRKEENRRVAVTKEKN